LIIFIVDSDFQSSLRLFFSFDTYKFVLNLHQTTLSSIYEILN